MEEKRELTNEEMEKVTGGVLLVSNGEFLSGSHEAAGTTEVLRVLKEKCINAVSDTNTEVDRNAI